MSPGTDRSLLDRDRRVQAGRPAYPWQAPTVRSPLGSTAAAPLRLPAAFPGDAENSTYPRRSTSRGAPRQPRACHRRLCDVASAGWVSADRTSLTRLRKGRASGNLSGAPGRGGPARSRAR